MNLTGKIAVVTGGSSGIGFGIAKRFAGEGAEVAILSNDARSLDAARAAIADGSGVIGIEADISRSADVEASMAAVVAEFGGIDCLVNSAGIQRYGTVVDTPETVWDEIMAVNLKGVYLASRFAIPEIARRGGGSIINIASVQAFASQSNVAAYTATKGAIVAMTRAMALDHAAEGIRVNAICPASVDTPMLRWAAETWKGEHTAEDTLAAWGRGHPIGRVGRVEEVAALANFLAGDQCGFMTGADLKIDGGVMSKLGIVLPE